MSNTILTSIEEMVEAAPGVDNEDTFTQLWQLTTELFERVRARFDLTRDPSCEGLMPYQGNDGASGYLATYSGPEIDWLVHSWTGNPKATFTNMHLTIGLGPHIDAPHFGFALGTTPDIFMYMDYLPRRDLWTHPDYADRYYGEANKAYLALQANPQFRPFISRDFYTRVAQTPASLCYGAAVNDDNLATVRAVAHAHLDQWLQLVDNATPTAPEQRAQLAERDFFVRHTITERDPANIVVDKLFGVELGRRLVRQLWGGDRKLPRPS